MQIERIESEISQLNKLLEEGILYKLPEVLYHEPQQIPGFTKELARAEKFTPRLRIYLQRRFAERYAEEERRRSTFLTVYRGWHKRLRAVEANDPPAPPVPCPSQPEATTLPTAITATSVTGRGTRRTTISDAVRSEEELNQVLLSLLEQERDNPATRWMATLVATPPMLAADPKHIFKSLYLDTNGKLLQDAFCPQESADIVLKSSQIAAQSVVHYNGNAIWTEAEQKVFIDKFLINPKNFRKIASYLPFKSTADCVAFYYRSKKRLRLKQLRKMIISESAISRVKPPKRNQSNGPGRPPKKVRKPGRPPRSGKATASSMEEESDLSSAAIPLKALMTTNSPLSHFSKLDLANEETHG